LEAKNVIQSVEGEREKIENLVSLLNERRRRRRKRG